MTGEKFAEKPLFQIAGFYHNKEGIYNVKKGPHQGAPFTFFIKPRKLTINASTIAHLCLLRQISLPQKAEMRFLHLLVILYQMARWIGHQKAEP
ncbi:MAG: hypothetical protein Ct9H300mP23_02410 [Nitrospinota bacterium]|nr:MAG: hypothetical protein Ct9H300mP23_02410 [Nitrospinota bacterium]